MELKRGSNNRLFHDLQGLNRTFMELKHRMNAEQKEAIQS